MDYLQTYDPRKVKNFFNLMYIYIGVKTYFYEAFVEFYLDNLLLFEYAGRIFLLYIYLYIYANLFQSVENILGN